MQVRSLMLAVSVISQECWYRSTTAILGVLGWQCLLHSICDGATRIWISKDLDSPSGPPAVRHFIKSSPIPSVDNFFEDHFSPAATKRSLRQTVCPSAVLASMLRERPLITPLPGESFRWERSAMLWLCVLFFCRGRTSNVGNLNGRALSLWKLLS